jgi:hypothetical protein
MMKSKKTVVTKKAATKKSATKKITPKAIVSKRVTIDHFLEIKQANEYMEKARAQGLQQPLEYDVAIFKEMLSLPKVATIRIYTGINPAGQRTYVLVPCDKSGIKLTLKRRRKAMPISKSAKAVVAKSGLEEGYGDLGQVCDPVMKTYGLG